MLRIMHRHIGRIYEIISPEGKSEAALAIAGPDEKGDMQFLAVSPNGIAASGDVMELPEGLMPAGSVLRLDKKHIFNRSCIRKELAAVDMAFLEKALRTIVLNDAANYYNAVHKYRQNKEFVPGKSGINYAGRIYDYSEIRNVIDASLEFYLTAGRYDREFCKILSGFMQSGGVPEVHTLTVNSGSSANLVALSVLTSPKLGDRALQEGDEVITVCAGFPTSISPIVQNRLIPVFVDIETGNYNIDAGQIEKAISSRTKAIMVAHALGIPFVADRVLEIAEKYNLWLIEDNCDALGAEYTLKREYSLIKGKKVSGRVKTGTLGHLGTSSFYPAHQITMGEGGAVYTSDRDLYRIALSFRDWGRDCWCEPGKDNTCGRRFGWSRGLLPEGYDHKYVYSHLGYNLKITDMQAAIGVAQLHKLPGFASIRYSNWKYLRENLEDLKDTFILPKHPGQAVPSPFGFALTLREGASISRNEVVSFLESKLIQTRPMFAGNILRQPAFTDANIRMRILDSPIMISKELSEADTGRLPVSEEVMQGTFWFGVYPGIGKLQLDYIIAALREFLKGKRMSERAGR
jgi:CDP-4-dehydro-6-deoxyglucose reductase, E1